MGWIDLFWNLAQESRLRSLESRTTEKRDIPSPYHPPAEYERLVLVTHALWELLSERVGISDAELLAKIQEIDARDGQADGRMRSTPTECPKCRRANTQIRTQCLYCGANLPRGNPLAGI